MRINRLINTLKEHQDKTFGIEVFLIGEQVNNYFLTNIGYCSTGNGYYLYFDSTNKEKFPTEEFIDYMTEGGDYEFELEEENIKLAPKFDGYFAKNTYYIWDGLTIVRDSIRLVVNLLECDPYNNDYFKELVEKSKTKTIYGETDE